MISGIIKELVVRKKILDMRNGKKVTTGEDRCRTSKTLKKKIIENR